MRAKIQAKTDVGLQRMRNEDNFLIVEELDLVVVADGMGGHIDGNIASQLAVDTLKECYTQNFNKFLSGKQTESSLKEKERFLIKTVQQANQIIFEKNRKFYSLEGMGTTLVALQITQGYALTGCVGDSRIYRLRGDEFKQITQDHSLVGELARYNIIGKEDLIFIQNKNIITRALGMTERVQVDTTLEKVEPGDIYLLCSDGLSDLVDDERLQEILQEINGDLEEGVSRFVEEANLCGGADNITVALVGIPLEKDVDASENNTALKKEDAG